jgi:DNA uptake protein ComE-like DNA-binding protein
VKFRFLLIVLTAAPLVLGAGNLLAAENKADASSPAAVQTDSGSQNVQRKVGHKHSGKIRLVDINSATKEELKKLPGIGDAEADKILVARPFGSKAWLVSDKIISLEAYQAVKGLIVCKLTKRDVEKIKAKTKPMNK